MSILKKYIPIVVLLVSILFTNGCQVLNYVPPKDVQQRNLDRERVIENHLKVSTHASKRYESLGFGVLNVYKPAVFLQLDSLYDIKYAYESENRHREYKLTGNEELIEAYRAKAEAEKSEITYELEHIYSIQKELVLSIYHDYFLMDDQDSILSRSTLYTYTIPVHLKDIQLKYLFELHFITDHERFITREEFNFIKFFKELEQQLIGDDRLQDFMLNSLRLMNVAHRQKSTDFVVLTQAMLQNYIIAHTGEQTSINYESLLAQEGENNEVLGYKRTARWREKDSQQWISTTMDFSPYLEVTNIQDQLEN